MAGYSGTPLVRRLGIKEGARVGVVGGEKGFLDVLGELPVGAVVGEVKGRGAFDVIVCFVRSLGEVDFEGLKGRLDPAGGLWMAWPKRSSGIQTDVGEKEIRAGGLAAGLVDNKVCAIDETWSGLRFVVRLADRPKMASRR